jgi:mRNA interferase HicA
MAILFDKLAHVIKNDYTVGVNSSELKRWLAKQGATFGGQTGSHLKVSYQGRQSILPMHGKKELPRV